MEKNKIEKIFSSYFREWLVVTKYVSDEEFYFNYNGRTLRNQTPMSYFIEKNLVKYSGEE